jgi:hypothetical protein
MKTKARITKKVEKDEVQKLLSARKSSKMSSRNDFPSIISLIFKHKAWKNSKENEKILTVTLPCKRKRKKNLIKYFR